MIRLMQDWVTRQAELRPNARAIVGSESSLSYQGLETLSNQIAHRLYERGCRRGDRVALLLPQDPLAVSAILGVLKVGGIYVPLNPDDPAPRIRQALHGAEPRVVLVSPGTSGRMLAGYPALSLDDVESAPRVWPSSSSRDPGAPAYILYTSGSTGIPKGVAISHQNVIRFIQWAVRHFRLDTGARLSGHAPLTFDLSTFDLYATFASGGELHLVPRELNLLPHRIVQFMSDRKLTHWFSVPSILELVQRFDALPREGLPRLRTVAWCGEVLPVPALRYWMERLPDVVFSNLYGPTETTVASSFYQVPGPLPEECTEIPIGTGCDGEEVLVLDGEMRRAEPGETGHIFIRGNGVGIGYWRDAPQTQKAFVPDPFSDEPDVLMYRTGDLGWMDEKGLVHFVGRQDHQIKSRGYRIELGEVEAAFHAVPEVSHAVALGIESGDFQGKAIACAYVLSEGEPQLPARKVRERLKEVLPAYMVPTRFRQIDELPLAPSGKIDRAALRRLFLDEEVLTEQMNGPAVERSEPLTPDRMLPEDVPTGRLAPEGVPAHIAEELGR